jgi:glycerol uptake facilitator-like aquaporin
LIKSARSGGAQWLAEVVASFGLLTVIFLSVKNVPQQVALNVGLYITAAYWFTASTSFANPAVTLARSFSDTFAGIRPEDVMGFVLAQIIGAAFAVAVDRLVWSSR